MSIEKVYLQRCVIVTRLLPINMGMPQYKAFGCVRRDPFTLAMGVKEGDSDSSEKEKKKEKEKESQISVPFTSIDDDEVMLNVLRRQLTY